MLFHGCIHALRGYVKVSKVRLNTSPATGKAWTAVCAEIEEISLSGGFLAHKEEMCGFDSVLQKVRTASFKTTLYYYLKLKLKKFELVVITPVLPTTLNAVLLFVGVIDGLSVLGTRRRGVDYIRYLHFGG
jgi:hypothetical protein